MDEKLSGERAPSHSAGSSSAGGSDHLQAILSLISHLIHTHDPRTVRMAA